MFSNLRGFDIKLIYFVTFYVKIEHSKMIKSADFIIEPTQRWNKKNINLVDSSFYQFCFLIFHFKTRNEKKEKEGETKENRSHYPINKDGKGRSHHIVGLKLNLISSAFSAGRPRFSNISLNTVLYSSSGIFLSACVVISARISPKLLTYTLYLLELRLVLMVVWGITNPTYPISVPSL
jgi:hypothetical protein